MQSSRNPFKSAIRGGRPLVGVWSMSNSTNAVEALAHSGYDWLLLDGEHSPQELADVMNHLRALAASTTMPIVRIATNDPILFKRYLDAGVTTVMVPYVQSAAEARAAVQAMYYPPAGQRGVAVMHRASRFGRVPDYLRTANDGICLIVQLETQAAIAQLEDIAAEGVDALFIGPGDLSATMGYLGQPDHPKVQEVIADAFQRARRAKIPMGILAANPAAAERYIAMGFAFVSVANDLAMLVHTADACAARYRELAAAASR
ncbi:HpcH/HpaI aldolase/citrate lyase family protein [Ramlibacter sp.]|uniref:HpcH/HpaI aldolase family protein n=1 Tax=Ramlibacter sp. TaxID=1917967 RepID=UPI002B8E726C|nr:HpcH/HpaI aldolase/citrate lyase family protein [Ramlibacter sp.]HWI82275.1 HpcH/HpaI aldolase/citrate lyase family protein [Ramlibacter sp.]